MGSINNIALNKINFSKISNIKILGFENINKNLLLNSINNLELGNIFFINKSEIKDLIEENTLVESYDVFKIYPSSLHINIQKTKFLARTDYNGENYIIGSNGKLIKDEVYNEKLPYIFGKPKIKDFLRFKEIINTSKFKYKDIKNLYYFPSGRWDLQLVNKVIIKLPEKSIEDSLELAFEFLNNNKKKISFIDARVDNQIILND
jgi:cell division protein FtsQ